MIKSLTQYRKDYKKSVEDPKEFWLRYSKSFLWSKVPKDILSWNFEDPDVKWFADGKMNITENIFERNKKNENDTAIIWEPTNQMKKILNFLTPNYLNEYVLLQMSLKLLE